MALTQCDVAVNNVQQLDDEPNDTGGMTAVQLKAVFDKTGADLKTFINDTLIPEIVAALAEKMSAMSVDDTPTDSSANLVTSGGVKAALDAHYVTAGRRSGSTLGLKATAEGYLTTASERWAHAEGWGTIANGEAAHADGSHAQATGNASHASGSYTVAYSDNQFVFGRCNVVDPEGRYIEIVGKGSVGARSNARTLDWDGSEKLAGSLTLGMGTANETTITAAQLKQLLALLG